MDARDSSAADRIRVRGRRHRTRSIVRRLEDRGDDRGPAVDRIGPACSARYLVCAARVFAASRVDVASDRDFEEVSIDRRRDVAIAIESRRRCH
jgi:hypothetical protein